MEPVHTNGKMIPITGMEPEFYRAALEGNIDAFKEKREQIESILTPNKNTILHIHLTNYSDKVSQTFVEAILRMCPALVMKANAKNETILHIAARYGHSEIVEKIIQCVKALPQFVNEAEAEKRLIRAINDKEDTALHEAVRYRHTQVVELLTKEDPDHPYLGNCDEETPLYVAVERQYWDVVNIILENSNSPNHDGPNGRTALHAAVLHGHKEIVSKLLTRTSAAKQADENGWVPLHLAALSKSPDLAKVLLRYDRNTAYMRDNRGRTALHFAACSGNARTMQKILKYCPDCSELVDENGCNALHYTTVRKVRNSAAKVILEKASLSNLYNEKDDRGNTPLHHLARYAPQWKRRLHHPLLNRHPRVDIMSFGENNQTALDVAYDHVPSPLARENFFLREMQQSGGRFGGRVIHKDVRRKKKENRYDSGVDKNKKREERNESDVSERVRATVFVVATLIATVTFAAGFSMPGGTIQDGEHKGSPILKYNAAFKAFIITDSLSFVLSAFSTLIQIFWSFIKKDEIYIGVDELFALTTMCLTMSAMVFMIIAFVTGTYAVLNPSKGLGVVTLLIGLSFFLPFIYFLYMIYRGFKKHVNFFVPQRSFREVEDIQMFDRA